MIRKLGSDPDQLFSYGNFQSELKKFGKFAFIWAPIIIQNMLSDPKDIVDLDELSDEKPMLDIVKGYDIDSQAEYNNRINDLLTDLIAYDYYWK